MSTRQGFTLFSTALVEICFLLYPAIAQDNNTLRTNISGQFMVHDGRGESYASHMPFLAAFGNTVFCSIHQHPDDYIMHPTDAMRISYDNGVTWPTLIRNQDFYLTSLIKLTSDTLFGMAYIDYYLDSRHSRCHFWKSPDNGTTWTHDSGTVTFPSDITVLGTGWSSIVFHRSMIQMADGSLQGTMYGKYGGDAKSRCLWVKSIDNGKNWNVVSTIAYDGTTGEEGFCEPTVVKCVDSSLLCVMRVGYYPLYQCRSTDNGLTWSVPQKVHRFTAPGISESQTYTVDPDLCLMSNGVLALVYGRSKNYLLLAKDGNGNLWDKVLAIPQSIWPGEEGGYMGVREVSPNKLLIVGENRTVATGWKGKVVWGNFVSVNKQADGGIDSFEQDIAGDIPAGYSQEGPHVNVVNTFAYQSNQSLRLHDTSSSFLTNAVKQTTADSSKTFEAMIYPVAAPNGIVISINSGGNDLAHSVFHIGVFSDGSIKWYDGSVWNVLGGAGTIAFNSWNKIRIDADTRSGAGVYVNDAFVGLAGDFNAFPTMDRVRLLSGSTPGIGDDFYVDNLFFYGFSSQTATDQRTRVLPANRPDLTVFSDQIVYSLPVPGQVGVSLYAIDGRRVRTLVTGFRSGGTHKVSWNTVGQEGNPLTTGLYLITLTTGHNKLIKKLIIIR